MDHFLCRGGDVQGIYYGQATTSAGPLITTTSVINITPNVGYRLSFWARGTCVLFFGATSPSGGTLSSTAPGDLTDDSVWVAREFVFNVTVPAIRLFFSCSSRSSPLPNLRLDAVSLVPTIGGCPIPVGF
jgi:hypothetical protein